MLLAYHVLSSMNKYRSNIEIVAFECRYRAKNNLLKLIEDSKVIITTLFNYLI